MGGMTFTLLTIVSLNVKNRSNVFYPRVGELTIWVRVASSLSDEALSVHPSDVELFDKSIPGRLKSPPNRRCLHEFLALVIEISSSFR